MADPAPAATDTLYASDPEVAAIARVNEALSGLDPAVQQRVLKWAADKFNVVLSQTRGQRSRSESGQPLRNGESEGGVAGEVGTFADFASLYDAANPPTDAEKALVAGYWLQVVQGKPDWDGFSANKALRNLGHAASNITVALSQLIDRSPRLVIQTHKAGKTRQARKKYKVTGEGIKRVRQLLSNAPSQESETGGQG